jgi:hypothetical protein
MSQACPSCLWITNDDEAEECERCGERFDGKPQPVVNTEAVGVLALALLGYLIYQRLGGNAADLSDGIRTAAVSFYAWILGPDEIFKTYWVIMLVIIAITWVVLWLLAQFQR